MGKTQSGKSMALAGLLYMAAHVFSESLLIGICGVKLDLDVLLMDTMAYLIVGFFAGAILDFALWFRTVKNEKEKESEWPYTLLMFIVAGIFLGYTIVLVVYRSYVPFNVYLCIVLILGIIYLIRQVFLGLSSSRRLILIALSLFLLLNTFRIGTLFRSELQYSGKSFLFYLMLFMPLVVCLILLEFTSREKSRLFSKSLIVTSGILLVVQFVSWSIVFPLEMKWGVIEKQFPQVQTASDDRPNVILVIFDTLRADYLDLFGCDDITMPGLVHLAHDNADYLALTRSHSSWTLPSHASIFTGLYPSSHGAHAPSSAESEYETAGRLSSDIPVLAEKIAELGYRTFSVSANFGYVHPAFGLARGFQYFDSRPGRAFFLLRLSIIRGLLNVFLHHITLEQSPELLLPLGKLKWFNLLFDESQYRNAGTINKELKSLLNGERAAKPFFLFVNYMDPHYPYLPPPEYKRAYFELNGQDELMDHPEKYYHDAILEMNKETGINGFDQLKSLYKASLFYLDSEFDALIDYLKMTGLFDNSIIVISSDHGEAFGEHKKFLKHGHSLYDPEILVPLIILAPEDYKNNINKIGGTLRHVDIFPSIMDILGENISGNLNGTAYGIENGINISELFLKKSKDTPYDLKAVISKNYKLIKNYGGENELYHLGDDPAERNNIFESSIYVAEPMLKDLIELDSNADSIRRKTVKHSSGMGNMEKLKSLGYIK